MEYQRKAIAIWQKNFDKSFTWFDYAEKIGQIITPSIDNVFPSLHSDEFDSVDETYEVSGEPILVSICSNTGRLVIEDGHHRYAKFLRDGVERIECKIEKVKPHHGIYAALQYKL